MPVTSNPSDYFSNNILIIKHTTDEKPPYIRPFELVFSQASKKLFIGYDNRITYPADPNTNDIDIHNLNYLEAIPHQVAGRFFQLNHQFSVKKENNKNYLIIE